MFICKEVGDDDLADVMRQIRVGDRLARDFDGTIYFGQVEVKEEKAESGEESSTQGKQVSGQAAGLSVRGPYALGRLRGRFWAPLAAIGLLAASKYLCR